MGTLENGFFWNALVREVSKEEGTLLAAKTQEAALVSEHL